MKALTKLQIETAEQVLDNALTERSQAIASAAYKKDAAKHVAAIEAFGKKAIALVDAYADLKKSIEKNPKLKVPSLSDYDCVVGKLPKSMAEVNELRLIGATNSSYSNRGGDYMPDVSKERAEIDRFILELKLGTALITDIDKLLEKINKIK